MLTIPTDIAGPHQSEKTYAAGVPLSEAVAAVILVHGRGASAPDILSLADEFSVPGVAYLAPQAAGSTWYPYGFLSPLEANQPGLDSGLRVIYDLVTQVQEAGLPEQKIVIGGFSQGACLAMEFVARHGRVLGGAFAFSGGLIGPPGTPRNYTSNLTNMPIFLGCSDIDSHIPLTRVQETTAVLESLDAAVTERIYPNMGHTVNQDEIMQVRQMLEEL